MRGEEAATEHLRSAGYSILERNFRTRHGELDVVASNSRYLVFCEVKTRRARAAAGALGPLVSVGGEKRRRLRLMARQWLRERASGERPHPAQMRFDAIGIVLDRRGRVLELEHVEDAF
jgi:putative endonuclease